MQFAKEKRPIKQRARVRSRRFTAGWLVLIALLGGTAVFALWRLGRPAPYRLFVSQPLRDGTRYAFLYASDLNDVREVKPRRGGPAASPADYLGGVEVRRTVLPDPFAPLKGLLIRAGLSRMAASDAPYQAHSGDISVSILAVAPAPNLSDSREHRRWPFSDFPGGEEWISELRVVDARSRLKFLVRHSGYCDPRRFARADSLLCESFRVLPPGRTPLPSPDELRNPARVVVRVENRSKHVLAEAVINAVPDHSANREHPRRFRLGDTGCGETQTFWLPHRFEGLVQFSFCPAAGFGARPGKSVCSKPFRAGGRGGPRRVRLLVGPGDLVETVSDRF